MNKIPKINPNPVLSWTNAKGKELTYTISSVDKLSLYRSCAFEGKPQYAVCWTLLQRFAFIYPRYKTFNSFAQAYVQPINPSWFITGSKHLSYISRLKIQFEGEELELKIADAERRAIKRKKQAIATIDNEKYIAIVEDVLNSRLISPGEDIIHYCASFATPKSTEKEARQEAIIFGNKRTMISVDFGQSFLPGTNWFFKTLKSSNLKLRIT